MKATLRDGYARRVRCDTETAKRIGVFEGEQVSETLYRNREGCFFLHLVGEGLCRRGPGGHEHPLKEEQKQEGVLRLMNTVSALNWCRQHLHPGTYEHIFEGMPEDLNDAAWEQDDRWQSDPNRLTEPITCTLPSGLVRRIERLAKQDGCKKSRIVEQALIAYFRERGEAK